MKSKKQLLNKLKKQQDLLLFANKEYKYFSIYRYNKKARHYKSVIPLLKMQIETLKWILK